MVALAGRWLVEKNRRSNSGSPLKPGRQPSAAARECVTTPLADAKLDVEPSPSACAAGANDEMDHNPLTFLIIIAINALTSAHGNPVISLL